MGAFFCVFHCPARGFFKCCTMFQVGTGFSFTKDDAGYATNEVDVARDLYRCLHDAEPSEFRLCAHFEIITVLLMFFLIFT